MSLAWQKAHAVTPKFTGLISAVSSSVIVYMIIRNHSKKNSYHRIILGMSLCDICASTAWFFSTWPEPVGTKDTYGAIGTQATCSVQGFFAQLSTSTIFYSGMLSIYYLLILVYGWDKEKFSKIEPFLHLIAWGWGIGTAIAGLALGLFNPGGYSCWIAPKPLDCVSSWAGGDEGPKCERGDNAHTYLWIFFYGPLWIVILLVSFCMTWVYWSLSQEEKQSITYANEDQNAPKPKKSASRRMANRAGLYVGAFYLTWIMPTILEIRYLGGMEYYPTLIFLAALFIPMQGFFNLVIYTLPAFARYRKLDHVKVKDQVLVLVWFKMIAFELGCLNDPEEDQRVEENHNNESNQRSNGLEEEPATMTMNMWMNNPHGADSSSNSSSEDLKT